MVIQRGYSDKYGIVYRNPYINQKQTIGIRTSFFFKQNNEAQYNTFDNKPLFYRDYEKHIIQLFESKISFSYRKKLFDIHTVEFAHNYWFLNDTLIKLNPSIFDSQQNRLYYFYLHYAYTFNNTDIQYYPLNGWVVGGSIIKNGLGIKPLENVDNFFIFGTIKKFTSFTEWLTLANGVYGKWTDNRHIPFFFNRSIGYGNNSVRGYEYYIIDGQRYIMSKNSLKFRIIKPYVFHLKWLKIQQFNSIPFYSYLNLFFDAAYVEDKFYYRNNPLNNQWIYGYGVGLDLISYYDLVLRIEFAINSLSQTGVYLHLNVGI